MGERTAFRKAKLGSKLTAARDGTTNAMAAGSDEHRCLAAVVGGHLWKGAADATVFESALNGVAAPCKAAGLRALGKGTQSSCTSGAFYEKAACAAAEGLSNNDAPVKSVLIPNAGDGDYTGLYYSYMLYLVAGDRWASGQNPSFYPTVGPPMPDTGSPPQADGSPPVADSPMIMSDAGVPIPMPREAGTEPASSGLSADLLGGCAVGQRPTASLLAALVLGLLLLQRRRR